MYQKLFTLSPLTVASVKVASALAMALVTTVIAPEPARALNLGKWRSSPSSRSTSVKGRSTSLLTLRPPLRAPGEILKAFQPRLTHDLALAQAFEAHLVRSPKLPKVPSRWKAWGLKALHVPAIAAVPAALTLPSYFIGWGSENAASAAFLTTFLGTVSSGLGSFLTYNRYPGFGLKRRIRDKIFERNEVIAQRERIGANAMILALAQTDNADLSAIGHDLLKAAMQDLKADDPAEWRERIVRAMAFSETNEQAFNEHQASTQRRVESAAQIADARKAFKIPPTSR